MEQRPAHQHEPQSVADILPAPGAMLACCDTPACGAMTVLDIDAGLHSYLKTASLNRLQDQLRCVCGGRRGRLEPWPAGLTAPRTRGRLYLFLI